MATRRTSKRKSAPRRPAARGLRARCVVRFDPGRVDLGGIAASMLDDLSDRAGAFVVEVLITERVQRVTYVGGKGKGLTVVYRGREGMDIWDAATRSVATIDPGMIPRSTISPRDRPRRASTGPARTRS